MDDAIRGLPEQFGRYRILRRLGEGGMGSVYLAEDTRLKRKVALKVAHPDGPAGRQAVERFLIEAEAAAALDHPYLCRIYDIGEVDGVHYLTMEYIEGTTLAEVVGGKTRFSQRQVAAIVGKLALALHEAHAKGVVHRDLKPANVMIKKSGRKAPVIVDFGLARQLNAGGGRLTQTGQAMGTPHYMAIEQIRGDLAAIGPACDIYALGVILYELLTGRVPFDGPNPMVVVAQILTTQAAPPSTHRPDLDPKLEAICLKAMAREIRDRYASMADLAAALADYLKTPRGEPAGPETSARPPGDASPPTGSDTLLGQFLEQVAAGVDGGVIGPASRDFATSGPSRRDPRGRRVGWVAAAALLMAGLVAAWAGGVFKSGPPAGIEARLVRPRPHAVEGPVPGPPASNASGRTEDPVVAGRDPRPPDRPPTPREDEGGFVPAFNGKDLAGWEGAVADFEVRDGAVRCKPGRRGTLYYKKVLSDFAVRVEFRLSPGGNDGLLIRYPGPEKEKLSLCEIQVLDDFAPEYGGLDPRQYHGSAYGMVEARRGHLRPSPDWNTQEVTARGSSVKVELNGAIILDTDLDRLNRYMNNDWIPNTRHVFGYFGLAGHGEPVDYRKIEIKELRRSSLIE